MCHPAHGTDEMLLGEREEEKKEVMDNGNQWKADECQKVWAAWLPSGNMEASEVHLWYVVQVCANLMNQFEKTFFEEELLI